MNVNVTSKECAWFQAEFKLLGATVTGITAFELKKETEKEHVFGAGQHAIDINAGNIKCSGSITVMGFELQKLNKAAQIAGFGDISEVPHESIVMSVTYKKFLGGYVEKKIVRGVAFTEIPDAMSQNDKSRSLQLPFLCMDITSL